MNQRADLGNTETKLQTSAAKSTDQPVHTQQSIAKLKQFLHTLLEYR